MHEVESAMYYKEPAWHGLGTVVSEAKTAAEAMRIAKLDWTVEKAPLFFDHNDHALPYDDHFALVRSTDSAVLGDCTDKYEIDQNIDGFDWANDLLGEGATFESAMSLRGGRLVALLAHMPEYLVLGEAHRLYMLISLWHDAQGKSSLKLTDERVVCKNTWNAAMSGAGDFFSYSHVGDLKQKRDLITKTLKMAGNYQDALAMTASHLVQTNVTQKSFIDIINEVWPEPKELADRTPRAMTMRGKVIDQFLEAVQVPDLKQFRGTAWAIMQAAAAFDTHAEPLRKTESWKESRFINLMESNGIQQSFQKAIEKVCGVAI